MNCPLDLADIILKLIESGTLRARAFSWQGDAAGCANESDHIHNLPSLLSVFCADRLRYYWEVERPVYLAKGGGTGMFEATWAELGRWIERTGRAA
ncbi:MAG: hypothetical protein ACJ8F7_21955 [Gemmataceae bacterium]